MKRVFAAIVLDDESRHVLAEAMRPESFPGRPVHPGDWHLTLRFIGDVDRPVLDRIIHELDQADLGPGFAVTWGGLGAFPRPSKATVLWLGVDDGVEQLTEVAARTEAGIVAAGLDPEERPFRAHLTLSRIRPQQDVRGLVENSISLGWRMQCDALHLMESHLQRPRGSRYVTVEAFPLR